MPARHRQLSMGVLSESERARIIQHLIDHYGSVSQGLRALVSRDLIAHNQPELPPLQHGGRRSSAKKNKSKRGSH